MTTENSVVKETVLFHKKKITSLRKYILSICECIGDKKSFLYEIQPKESIYLHLKLHYFRINNSGISFHFKPKLHSQHSQERKKKSDSLLDRFDKPKSSPHDSFSLKVREKFNKFLWTHHPLQTLRL